LTELGYEKVYAIATGMTDWAQSGYPVQTSITDEQIILLPVEE
jgi:rhodanese-related sulfurtransferase